MAKKTTENPLLSRIGSKKPVKTVKTPAKGKANPLAAALKKGAISTLTLSDRIRPVGDKKATNGKAANGKASAKVQKTTPKKQVAAVSFTKYVEKVKKQQKEKTTQKPAQKTTQKKALLKTQASAPQKTTVLSIKSTGEKKFLRIKNLEIGTSSTDLKTVLANMGQLIDIRVKDLPSGSTTAEVEFQTDRALRSAADKLNGAVADGRVIQVEVSSRREL